MRRTCAVGLTSGRTTNCDVLSAEKWERKDNQCATEDEEDVSDEGTAGKEVVCKAKNSYSLNKTCLDM